jgi:predicted ArsR family transcriptional regulator
LDRTFFESTRGRIVALLRRTGLTVDELAQELGLTANGVRAHLATLERDGIVR